MEGAREPTKVQKAIARLDTEQEAMNMAFGNNSTSRSSHKMMARMKDNGKKEISPTGYCGWEAVYGQA